MVDVCDGCLWLWRIADDGLEVPEILRGEVVGMGRDEQNKRTAGIIAEAIVKNILYIILYCVFALIHQTSVYCRVSIILESILKERR